MLNTLLAKLGLGDGSHNIEADHRRKYIRLSGVPAEVEMGQQAFPVRDWSPGGVFFEAKGDSHLAEGDRVMVTLRFRFPHETVAVEREVRVVRAAGRGVAAEFGPLSNDDRKQFDRILDNYHAENFAASQLAA